jgi:hypothetical protein
METQPARIAAPVHAPKAKPDPRPMRVALGFGGIAALSALSAAIVLPPRPVTSAPVTVDQPASAASDSGQGATSAAPTPGTPQTSPTILYIQLAPGQTAPPGATVIDATAAPKAGGVVSGPAPVAKPGGAVQPAPVQVAPPKPAPVQVAPPKPAPTPIVIKTTQSGKVIP